MLLKDKGVLLQHFVGWQVALYCIQSPFGSSQWNESGGRGNQVRVFGRPVQGEHNPADSLCAAIFAGKDSEVKKPPALLQLTLCVWVLMLHIREGCHWWINLRGWGLDKGCKGLHPSVQYQPGVPCWETHSKNVPTSYKTRRKALRRPFWWLMQSLFHESLALGRPCGIIRALVIILIDDKTSKS